MKKNAFLIDKIHLLYKAWYVRKICAVFILIFSIQEVSARPEYALQIRTNRCTTCHANPVGGGHRNLTGKAFGPKSAPLEAFSQQDLFGFDFRTIFYTPAKKEHTQNGKSGLGIMAALPSISVPFNKVDGREWRLVYSHNIGGFNKTSPRDAYLRIQFYEGFRNYPQYVLIGRFSAPFGLLNDEHRTYIRQQTKTSWNDQEVGVLFSGDLSYALHYDLAVVNGEQTAGTGFGSNQSFIWGGIFNMRAFFANLGWMLGASTSYYTNDKNSSALSVYQNLALDSLTKNLFPGNLTAEAVLAHKMNSRMAPQFFSENKYREEILDSDSFGYKVQWNYNFFPDWKFIFKYDYLLFDIKYTGDSYQKYGFGVRHFFNNQVSAQVRYERAVAKPESEKTPQKAGLAAQDSIWALLQVKI